MSNSLPVGFICLNAENTDGCDDYKVRYCCDEVVPLTCKDTEWSPWYDRDNTGGFGDFETFAELYELYPRNLCE